MLGSLWEKIKAHPALLVGGLVLFVTLVYLLNRGSNADVATYSMGDGSQVGAATALQTAQLQAASQTAQIGAAVQANAQNIAGQIELAKIARDAQGTHDQLTADVALANISAQQQLGSLVSTLQAQTTQNAQNQQTAQTSIVVGGQTQQQKILADALVQQSANQAQVAIAGYNAQKDIATQSWFDKIFG